MQLAKQYVVFDSYPNLAIKFLVLFGSKLFLGMFPASSTSLVTLKYLDDILCFVTMPVENTELIAFDCSACPVREQSSPYPWPEHLWHFAGLIIFVSSVVGRFISCPLSWIATLSPGEPLFWLYWQSDGIQEESARAWSHPMLLHSFKDCVKIFFFMKIVWICCESCCQVHFVAMRTMVPHSTTRPNWTLHTEKLCDGGSQSLRIADIWNHSKIMGMQSESIFRRNAKTWKFHHGICKRFWRGLAPNY